MSRQNNPHPFGDDDGYKASWCLARHNNAAIKGVISLPAQAMAFLQKLARAMAHENKPRRWVYEQARADLSNPVAKHLPGLPKKDLLK